MAGKHFEVERKFRISPDEFEKLPAKLAAEGFKFTEKVSMTDTFLPIEQEEAILRLRQECTGTEVRNVLTKKEWVYQLGGDKERQEHEEPVGEFAAQTIAGLGKAASKEPLLVYGKDRWNYAGSINEHKVVVALDAVEGLGEYSGNYMEVEILVEGDGEVESARKQVFEFAHKLLGDKRDFEPMSYKTMLENHKRKAQAAV